MSSKPVDMLGRKFGELRVFRYADKTKEDGFKWLCRCSCGKEAIVSGKKLRSGERVTCGCRKFSKRHVFNDEMDRILKAHYPQKGSKYVIKCIQEDLGITLTVAQVQGRAAHTGIKYLGRSVPTQGNYLSGHDRQKRIDERDRAERDAFLFIMGMIKPVRLDSVHL